MSQSQKAPQRIAAPSTENSSPATFIFLHGYGDDADGWISLSLFPSSIHYSQTQSFFIFSKENKSDSSTDIAHQFHSAHKLPHLTWLFPNAPHNHEAMTNAWYTPTSFSPIPVGRSSITTSSTPPTPEAEFVEENESEILASVEYVNTLVDAEISAGVPISRIVVGGFSQGCAISLVLGLTSRYAGKLGAVVGLSGYLPRGKKIKEGREGFVKGEGMKVFLAHGTRDLLVPVS